jgi:hypothetical protein
MYDPADIGTALFFSFFKKENKNTGIFFFSFPNFVRF